jgi:hypothetical protein
MSTPVDPDKMSRRQQIVQTYRMAKKSDTRLPLWLLLSFVVGAAVGFGLFFFLPGPGLLWGIAGGILIGFLGVMSGPLVRSSYRAGRLYQQALEARAKVHTRAT